MRFFIGKDGQQLGPFSEEEVRSKLISGTITYSDLIWREGMAAWAPIHTIITPLGHSSPPLPTPPPAPTSATAPGVNPFVSAVTREEPTGEPQLADRGKRLLAVLLDGFVTVLIMAPGLIWFFINFQNEEAIEPSSITPEELITLFADPLLVALVPLLVLVVIQVYLLCKHGQTLGKRWVKIRIVRTDGSPVGFVHAILLRSFVMQLIGAIPFVGALVSLADPLLIFREDRRCIHDLIADTCVIDA